MQSINVGLVGVANHGNTIRVAIQGAQGLHLQGCFDINVEALSNCANQHGCKAYASFEAMLEDPDIHAVALVTPNHLHAAQMEAAFKAGKHVFVDKPITNTIAEARAMITLAEASDKVLYVGHNTRNRRVFRRAKALLQENALGTLIAVEANLSRIVGLTPEMPAWKADIKNAPLLPMTQLGIHFVDVALSLIAPVKRVSCFARTAALQGTAYDTTTALLELENGIPVTLNSYYVTPDTYFFRIYGTEGVLECHPLSLHLRRAEGTTTSEEMGDEGYESYILEMEDFAQSILNHKKPETGGFEGLHNLAVMQAMIQSIQTGQVISIQSLLN